MIWSVNAAPGRETGAGEGIRTTAQRGSAELNNDSEGSKPRARDSGERKRGAGAGEGIRTLDPNLGKVVLYP